MNIKYNYKDSDAYMYNIAFIKALLIKSTINNLPVPETEKEEILEKVLDYLNQE